MTAINKKSDLTQGPLLSKIILFSLPLMATGILQLLFNTADTIVVGRWGGDSVQARESALAAVGSCGSLINLIVSLFMGLSAGTGVCMAHAIGAKQEKDAERVVHTAVITAVISGTFVTVIGLLFAPSLLKLMNTPESVLDQAVPYICAYFCGMPANMLYNYCAAILRSSGDTTRPMLFLSIAGVVNVILNLIMVLVFHMGALGVGIATAASHWVSGILILLHMLHIEDYCHLDLKKLTLHIPTMKRIFSIGIPAGIQSTFFALSNMIIQSSVNTFGDVVIAGNSASNNLGNYIYTCQNAFYHTAMTFVGQNIGAKKIDRVKKSILYCIGVVTVVGLVVGNTIYLFGSPLLRIFAPDNTAVVEAGMVRLAILAPTYFMLGIMDVENGTLRAFGKSLTPMIVTLAGSCLLRIIWIYTVFRAYREQQIIYYSYPISWCLTALVLLAFVIFAYREFKRKEQIESKPFDSLTE